MPVSEAASTAPEAVPAVSVSGVAVAVRAGLSPVLLRFIILRVRASVVLRVELLPLLLDVTFLFARLCIYLDQDN